MARSLSTRFVTVTAALFALGCVATAAEPKRTPWTGSRVTGSPDPPPPYKVVRAFPNLKFDHPLLMARAPGLDRLFVGEERGVLHSFRDRPDAKAELFFDLRNELKTIERLAGAKEVGKVYGLAFHPQFEKNRQCFVCYTLKGGDRKQRNLKDGTRVSRFTVTKADPPRIDPDSEEVVLSFLQGGHNGGDLHFGPDRMLYITTGDGSNPNPPDDMNTGQDISDLLSSVLRIDVDRKENGLNYAVPKDNPFVNLKGARPEVWAYGFRNPWRMSFDRQTGELFLADVGWELWEMVYRVEKGGNYGWSATEGPQPIKANQAGPTPIRRALIDLPHAIACSVTGGYVYRGKKFPELVGAYIFGDWETRRMWAARFDGDRCKEMVELTAPSVRIVSYGEDAVGEQYFLDYDGGTVHTIERETGNVANVDFPKKLSETGLYASVKDDKPAPGILPYSINSRQWQDGATAEYWMALPNDAQATLHPVGKPIPGNVDWRKFRVHFPKDAVLTKTLSLGGKRVETQLMHFDGVDWHPYSFAWRDDQSDADLVPADGSEKEVSDGKHKRVWQFHSRSQCMSCHNHSVEYTLSFSPEQLNRPGRDGRNQLVALTQDGYVRRVGEDGGPLSAFDASTAKEQKRLVEPGDEKEPLNLRARSYLHANCGHCHSNGGGGSVEMRMQFDLPPEGLKAIGVRPSRGDFGLPDSCIVKPGDPYASTLFFRMAKLGRDRMPHIGSEVTDEVGLKLVEEWIRSLGKPAPATVEPAKALADPRTALIASRQLQTMSAREQTELLAAAGKLSPSPVRDLFEGYLPRDENAPRKLGNSPRPQSILALTGDAVRGEKLFLSKALNCASCHQVAGQGTAIGPELTQIGKQRSRGDLLESILEPSKRIEPLFSTFIVKTADGKSLTGLIVRRDDKQLVLRDAENKLITLMNDDVDEVRPSRASLMPDGQLAGLTPQEAADLLEYLATRR